MPDTIQTPDHIDEYLLRGIEKARGIKHRAKVRRFAGITAMLVLTLLIGGIRVSPAFATYASKIPGLEYIVFLINGDKGLQAAVDNAFVQHIDHSAEAEGIVFTVKDIIVDNNGMVVFYAIDNKSGYEHPRLHNSAMEDETGKDLEASTSHGYGYSDKNPYEGMLNFYFQQDSSGKSFVLPDQVYITTGIAVDERTEGTQDRPVPAKDQREGDEASGGSRDRVLESTWKVRVPIDKSKFEDMEKTYPINRTVSVEEQKITFEKVILYPTRVCIDIAYDPANTKKLFSFEDLVLTDESGNEWSPINNGISATLNSENSVRLYFQSNYFSNPRKLYLTGSTIRALDKDDLELVVDVEKEKLVRAPDGQVSLTGAAIDGNEVRLQFKFGKVAYEKGIYYGILGHEAWDARGNLLKQVQSGQSSDMDKTYTEMSYLFQGSGTIKGPIRFTVENYPAWISQTFRVEVPME